MKSILAVSAKHAMRLLCVILLMAALSCSDITTPSKTKPVTANGVIDQSDWDFNADGRTYLLGEWKFRWLEDNPSFADPKYDDSLWVNLSERGFWKKF